jgi:uncharacterized protein (TIRG00374 family)
MTDIDLGKDLRRILPGLLISLISLFLVFSFLDLDALIDALRRADYRYLLAGALLLLVGLLVRGMAWRTLLEEQATVEQVFWAINEGYLLNNLLPFRLGELGRALLLGQNTGMSFWQIFPTIMIERAFDITLSAGLLLSTLPFVIGFAGAETAAVLALIIVAGALAALHLLARSPDRAMSVYEFLVARIPLLIKIGRDRLESFLQGLVALVDLRRFLKTLGWMTLVWVLTLVEYYVILLAFVPSAPLLWAAFSLGVLAMGVSIPASPGSIGVFEASLVGALRLFSVDYDRTGIRYHPLRRIASEHPAFCNRICGC